MVILKKESTTWEELVMLEQRIICKFLPSNLNDLETFIEPIHFTPLNNNPLSIRLNNKRHEMMQETKRLCLNVSIDTYETKIKEYHEQYQTISTIRITIIEYCNDK
jgi:hypothetical protein